jgi:hypothetical protein
LVPFTWQQETNYRRAKGKKYERMNYLDSLDVLGDEYKEKKRASVKEFLHTLPSKIPLEQETLRRDGLIRVVLDTHENF